jgi:Glycosyl transferase family 2
VPDRPDAARGPGVPDEVRALVAEREERRRARDFVSADALRERIRDLGYEVVDGPAGPAVHPAAEAVTGRARSRSGVRPEQVESLLHRPPAVEFSVHWLVQGWPDDVRRGIAACRRHDPGVPVRHVVVDTTGADPATWPSGTDVVSLDGDPGFARAHNAGFRRAQGAVVVVMDGSVEPEEDVLTPLGDALADPGVGVAGPFGVVTRDLHGFTESPGPEVDAIEAYLMAFRRSTIAAVGGFDEQFGFYRAADLELSFRIRDRGLKAMVVDVAVRRHEHRMWASTPPERRDQLSKRNFYRFLERWRGRTDLCVGLRAG